MLDFLTAQEKILQTYDGFKQNRFLFSLKKIANEKIEKKKSIKKKFSNLNRWSGVGCVFTCCYERKLPLLYSSRVNEDKIV